MKVQDPAGFTHDHRCHAILVSCSRKLYRFFLHYSGFATVKIVIDTALCSTVAVALSVEQESSEEYSLLEMDSQNDTSSVKIKTEAQVEAAKAKAKPKFTPKAPPKKEIVEVVAAPVPVARYEMRCCTLLLLCLSVV